jgi:hypothetical protein
MSASSASLGTYSDSDFPSPGEFPRTPNDEFPFSQSSVPQYQCLDFHDQMSMGSSENFNSSYEVSRSLPMADDVSSSISSDQSVQDFSDGGSGQQSMGPPTFPDIYIEGDMTSGVNGFSQPAYSYLPTEGMSSNGSGPLSSSKLALTTAIPQSLTASPLSPRMQFLLGYYDRFICPVLVAFDDAATNPYRVHIMHLAMSDQGLQHAIAALATNNMRMRNAIQGRRMSFPETDGFLPNHAFHAVSAQELRDLHGEPSDEEKHYKATSIALLNRKLAHRDSAQDDSILATLLVLCLFHVCDSGFAKFKTQLAGVQKLLNLRDRNAQSQFTDWIEFFFTWFDVMASTVNDRETEVQGESLDMANLSANLGAREHLSGCEGRLFKLIARLGRLNLLSQNRPVKDVDVDTTPRASPKPRPTRPRDFYSFNFNQLDGNGWGSLVEEPVSPGTPSADNRQSFWKEWNEIRSRLQDWKMDTKTGAPPPGQQQGHAQNAALAHMSESFRYAALLYTERLGDPISASTAFNFQSLVAQGLYHISQIGIASCMNKFILWPLFIIGTECVLPEHRAMVRQRCIEIQRESGFFNNLNGLEVLEKAWQDQDQRAMGGEHGTGPFAAQAQQQAFRWRRAMNRVDGEYIVI